jgi:PIN domain nuclease of toxin-antitoxin system
LEDEEQTCLVSAISCWEVAMLVQRGRLGLTMDVERWLELLEAIPGMRLLPLTPAVAVAATRLPEPFHPDPADRFLVAQARELNIPLVTADSKIRAYPHLRSLW